MDLSIYYREVNFCIWNFSKMRVMRAGQLKRGLCREARLLCGRLAVGWFSRMQKCVTLSIAEADYDTMADILEYAVFHYVFLVLYHARGEWCAMHGVFRQRQEAIPWQTTLKPLLVWSTWMFGILS